MLAWTIADGHWSVSIVTDGRAPEVVADVYAAEAGEVIFRSPEDWKIPRTPGVNRLRWSVDAGGTITLVQIDSERIEPTFLAPWVRIGDAEG